MCFVVPDLFERERRIRLQACNTNAAFSCQHIRQDWQDKFPAPILHQEIRFRISGGEEHTIPPSEWARILRHLWRKRHQWSTILDLVTELRTVEVHPRLSQLRNRFAVMIDTQPAPDSGNPRSRTLLYRLSPRIEVLGENGND